MFSVAVMQSAAALERVAYEFAVDNYEEGVHYFECRFAPQLHANTLDGTAEGLDIENVSAQAPAPFVLTLDRASTSPHRSSAA